jgi:hypothetical protein
MDNQGQFEAAAAEILTNYANGNLTQDEAISHLVVAVEEATEE